MTNNYRCGPRCPECYSRLNNNRMCTNKECSIGVMTGTCPTCYPGTWGRSCLRHKCVCCPGPTIKDSGFCIDHMCPDCYSKGRGKRCSSHKCGLNGCDKGIQKGQQYCVEHGCIVCDPTITSPINHLCYHHGCCVAFCYNYRLPGLDHCEKHHCNICGKAYAGYDRMHNCRCVYPFCGKARTSGKLVCSDHICSVCKDEITMDKGIGCSVDLCVKDTVSLIEMFDENDY